MSKGLKATLIIGGTILALLALSVVIGLTANVEASCNVSQYSIKGQLGTSGSFVGFEETQWIPMSYSEDIVAGIEESNEDESIKAILLEVDSFGGNPVAGEEISNAVKRSEKPVIAVIRSAGTSAAYWAASGADTIFASSNSDVGSIGVMVGYLDTVEKNEKEGLDYNVITSGRYKLLGDPNVKLSEAERELLQRDVNLIHSNFVNAVSENRSLPLPEVEALADGSSMLGQMALEKKLVDRIGDMYDAKKFIAEQIGEDVEFCEEEYEY